MLRKWKRARNEGMTFLNRFRRFGAFSCPDFAIQKFRRKQLFYWTGKKGGGAANAAPPPYLFNIYYSTFPYLHLNNQA